MASLRSNTVASCTSCDHSVCLWGDWAQNEPHLRTIIFVELTDLLRSHPACFLIEWLFVRLSLAEYDGALRLCMADSLGLSWEFGAKKISKFAVLARHVSTTTPDCLRFPLEQFQHLQLSHTNYAFVLNFIDTSSWPLSNSINFTVRKSWGSHILFFLLFFE